jgi:hypothetical protein
MPTMSCAIPWLQVLKSEGPLALTTGLGPTLYRNCIWNSIYYGTMHEVRAGSGTLACMLVMDSRG